jgi:hypothetical protein
VLARVALVPPYLCDVDRQQKHQQPVMAKMRLFGHTNACSLFSPAGPAVSNPKDFPTSLIAPWVELGKEDPLGPYTKVSES